MPARELTLRGAVLAGAVVAAAAVGLATAGGVAQAAALVLGCVFVALALTDLTAAIAAWAATTFLIGLPGFYTGERIAAVVIFVAWLGGLAGRRSEARAVLARHPAVVATIALLLGWILLSVAWADNLGLVDEQLWRWFAAVLVVPVAATTLTSPSAIRLVLAGLVVGASLSIAIGFVAPDAAEIAPYFDTTALAQNRLAGAATDPNLLANGAIPTVVVAVALLAGASFGARAVLMGAVVLLVVGIVATASRGALVGSAAVAIAAPLLLRGRRGPVLAAVALTVAIVASALTLLPNALERIENAQQDDSGGGRTALWFTAVRMANDHPIQGVGIGNYPEHSPEYVTAGGALDEASVVAEQRLYAHNVYLQQAAETGYVGLALYLAVLATLLAAGLRAGWRLHASGDRRDAALALALMVGALSLLTTSVFHWWIDARLWLLLGMGVAWAEIARRRALARRAVPGRALPHAAVGREMPRPAAVRRLPAPATTGR